MAKRIEGFSLIEIMIAMAIFAAFVVSFIAGQGYNIVDSIQLKKDLNIMNLCEYKMNQLVINPPEFKETLTSEVKDTKQFEDYPDYNYNIEIKRIAIPNLANIQGKENDEEEQDEAGQYENKLFEVLKENTEKLLWQVTVTVTNIKTKESYSMMRWFLNNKEEFTIGNI